MFQPNLSSLPENKTRKKEDTHHRKAKTADSNSGKSKSNVSTTKTNVKHGQVERKPSSVNKTKSLPKALGRVSISEGFPLSDNGNPKLSSKQTTTDAAVSSSVDPRRSSFPVVKKSGRMRFAGIGKKVTSLVRARMAFQSNRKSRENTLDVDTMERIHEMPKAPRFSAFLSPEAQYAMMMGYEDVLHSQLSINHPEYRTVLKRNKTPAFRVGIVNMDLDKKKAMLKSDKDEQEADKNKGGRSKTEDYEEKRQSQTKEENDNDEEWKVSNMTRRQKTFTPGATSLRVPTPSGLRRSNTVTHTIPFDRRLHLTYRLESAMDILDTIRRRHGQPPISPRVRSNSREIAPVRDYNSWTNVWKKEFSKCDEKQRSRHVEV